MFRRSLSLARVFWWSATLGLIGVEGSRLRLREASRALQAAPSKVFAGGGIIWSILIYVEYLVLSLRARVWEKLFIFTLLLSRTRSGRVRKPEEEFFSSSRCRWMRRKNPQRILRMKARYAKKQSV